MEKLYFTGKDNGPTIGEFIQRLKSKYGICWKTVVWFNLTEEADKWYSSLDYQQLIKLSDKEFEKLLLDKWSRAKEKEHETHKGLIPTGISLLQIHGLIQKEKIIVFINLSCKHNFISVNLAKKLQVPAKQIEHTQIDHEDVQVYKDLKISMDKYVLHGDFYASEMNNMEVVLGYPWMESVGTLNINVQKKFLKLWYKKKKITLQDISIHKQVEHMEAEAEDVQGTDISDDEPLMINNQTQTEAAEETITGDDTSEEGSVVEVILKKKPPQQAPQQGEVKKNPSWVTTSTYHHPHHPARQPSRWQPISHMDNKPRRTDREEHRSTYCTSTQKSYRSQLPSQASEALARSRVHLSLGWLDARAWYQWTTLLSRSYYLVLPMFRGRNMLRGGGMLCTWGGNRGYQGRYQGNNVIMGWAIVINKVVNPCHVRDHK